MNNEQKKMIQVVLVILGCFGIYTYTAMLPIHHYCDYSGLLIQERFGHEVTFTFRNGSIAYYSCINISLIVFNKMVQAGQIEQLENVQVRCAQCGMLMDWDDPMNVWIYQEDYLCPTTGVPTLVVLCEGLCVEHFIDRYDGHEVSNPYVWS